MTVGAEPTHLARRDRFALAFRVAGFVFGLAVAVIATATSSWDRGWTVALFALATGGGALAYHLITSIVRCPGCSGRVFNLSIASDGAKRKTFLCSRCGAAAWLREGFYWQGDFSG
jgi:hypothetical protein